MKPNEKLKGYGSDKPIDVQCVFDAFLKIKYYNRSPISTKFFVVKGTNLSLVGYQTAIDLKLLRIGNENPDICRLDRKPEINMKHISNDVNDFPKIPIEGMKFRVNENVILLSRSLDTTFQLRLRKM